MTLQLLRAGCAVWLVAFAAAASGALQNQRFDLDIAERDISLRDYEWSKSAQIGTQESSRLCARASIRAKKVELQLRGVRGVAYYRERMKEDPWTNSPRSCPQP